MRQFGNPSADQEAHTRRQQPDREQAAPADIGFEVLSEYRPQNKSRGQHRGGHSGDPAASGGWYEFLHHGNIDRIEAGDAKPDQEAANHQKYPTIIRGQRHQTRRDREVQNRRDYDLAPADLVGDPAPDQRTQRRADSRGQQYRRRLAVGQMPVFDDERQHERDQQKIEVIEHVADRRRGEDLPRLMVSFFCCSKCSAPPTLSIPWWLTRRQVLGRHSPASPPTSTIAWFLFGQGNQLRLHH